MLSGDSGQGESICTPRSVSKRLFGAGGSSSKKRLFGAGGSSSKKRLFSQEISGVSKNMDVSGDESDLGPMSPLALTDHESNYDSSPGRSFVSPFTTPEKSPRSINYKTWDRLRPKSSKTDNRSHSPFDALKMLTKAARSSPNRKIIQNSPKSLSSTPKRNCANKTDEWCGTPERQLALLFGSEIVPETPRKDASDDNDEKIDETPEKGISRSEQRLVTPLSSVHQQTSEIIVPRLHRRKSLCPFDTEETSSPERKENVLKRRANDTLEPLGNAKIQKIDVNHSFISKARASLFRETTEKPDATTKTRHTGDFTLSTKSFYKNPGIESAEMRRRSIGIVDSMRIEKPKKRVSSYMSNHTYHKQKTNARKSTGRYGEMNAGVRHGIKRPKSKRHVSRIEAFKMEKQTVKSNDKSNDPARIGGDDGGGSADEFVMMKASRIDDKINDPPPPTPQSPIADPNKRFFKTNRTLKSHNVATVTVNNKIKLKVSDGKIALNEKHSQKNPRKRPRLEDMSFDATDLTVDEPNFDTSMEKRNVDGILKVLEDDWADDEYDTMETLTNISPNKTMRSVRPSNHVTMSPASVLSNMTLSMNIKDASIAPKASDDADNSGVKLYPLFAKGYSSNHSEDSTIENKKKSERGVKRTWQTSAKGGGADNQYQIDAGQTKFGATTCGECGIVYQQGEPEDENAHLIYHNNVKSLRFNGWKNERVIVTDPFTNSRIIGIEPGDSKQAWKKVELVLNVVDKDLGLADMELTSYLDKKIYFYVRDKTILGVMVAETISTAHRMIPEFAELNCCSAEETPAKCGINVIWTALSHRKQHIATKLVDALRTTYFFGYILTSDDIAFSMPTPSGRIFAEKYTKMQNFKVYN